MIRRKAQCHMHWDGWITLLFTNANLVIEVNGNKSGTEIAIRHFSRFRSVAGLLLLIGVKRCVLWLHNIIRGASRTSFLYTIHEYNAMGWSAIASALNTNNAPAIFSFWSSPPIHLKCTHTHTHIQMRQHSYAYKKKYSPFVYSCYIFFACCCFTYEYLLFSSLFFFWSQTQMQ